MLNASGRLKTAQLALELLLCGENDSRAEALATELKNLNEERKDMTQAGMEQAFEQVDTELSEDDVLVVYLPDCHESWRELLPEECAKLTISLRLC